MDSFPFSFNPVHGGLSAVSGVCRCEDDGIVCEFQIDIGGLGLRSGIKELRLAYVDMEECEFRRGWFGGKVIIQARGLKALSDFPGTEGNQVVFKVRRKDRTRAEMIATEIDLRRASANRVRQMGLEEKVNS
jgi:hypothetical protein